MTPLLSGDCEGSDRIRLRNWAFLLKHPKNWVEFSLDEEAAVQVVGFFARIVLITLGVVFMLSVMTGMTVIGYAVCRDFQPTISMVSTMRLSGMKW